MGGMGRGQAGVSKAGGGAIVALVLANVALSFGPWFVREADVGPVAAAWWRMGLAVPVLFLIAGVKERNLRLSRLQLWALAACGLFFAADLASWHLGILKTKLANANLLGNAASFLFPLYGFLVARRWPSRMQGIALVLAGLGTALLMGRSYELSRDNFIGDSLCLLAGLFYLGYLIYIDRMRGGMGPWPVLAWSTLASAVPLLIAANVMGEQVMPDNWTPLLMLAAGSQLIGQGLLVGVIGRLSPLVIGLALLLQPMISALLGWAVYGETMGIMDWAGALLIAVALVLVRQPAADRG